MYSLVRSSAVRECTVRASGLGMAACMAACLVYGAVRSHAVLSVVGCAVCIDIDTCAQHFTRVCVQYSARYMQRMAVCLMCGAVCTRATHRGGVCGKRL